MIQSLKIRFQNLFRNNKKESESDEKLPSTIEMWKFYLKHFKLDWKIITYYNASVLFNSFICFRKPFILLAIKDDIMNESNSQSLIYHIFELFFYEFLMIAQNQLSMKIHNSYFSNLRNTLESGIAKHIFSLDIQFFEENKASQLTTEITSGVQVIINDFCYNDILSQINTWITYGGGVYFIYTMSFTIFFFLFLVSLIFGLIEIYLDYKISKVQEKSSKITEFQQFALDDIMKNIVVIKSFGQEQKEIQSLQNLIEKNEKHQKASSSLNLIKLYLMQIKYEFQILLIVYLLYRICFKSADDSQISIVKFQTEMIEKIYSFIFTVQLIISLFVENKQSNFIHKQKYKKPTILYVPDDENNKTCLQGDISFQNVDFSYPKINDKMAKLNQKMHKQQQDNTSEELEDDKNSIDSLSNESDKNSESENTSKQVIKNFSLNIKRGQFVAFVGKSGSGKSTIAKLIQRLYDVNNGEISIDGMNLKQISKYQMKVSMGYVSQEPTMLDADIEANILYGNPLEEIATKEEELKRVCDISGVSEFVFDKKRFPEGLKTMIGTNGVKLSGGQKQRVAIARALIKNPSILILDEATSSLDAESEFLVQKYIDNIVQNRNMTIIVIAHRLSTIIKSDVIFVMEHGQLKEQGTHKQLISANGTYSKLFNRQVQFKKPDQNQEIIDS